MDVERSWQNIVVRMVDDSLLAPFQLHAALVIHWAFFISVSFAFLLFKTCWTSESQSTPAKTKKAYKSRSEIELARAFDLAFHEGLDAIPVIMLSNMFPTAFANIRESHLQQFRIMENRQEEAKPKYKHASMISCLHHFICGCQIWIYHHKGAQMHCCPCVREEASACSRCGVSLRASRR